MKQIKYAIGEIDSDATARWTATFGYVSDTADEAIRKHDEFFVGEKRFVKLDWGKEEGKRHDLWTELAGNCECEIVSWEE